MSSHWPVIISFLTAALCSVGAAAAPIFTPTFAVQVSAASNTRNMSGPNDYQSQTGQVPLDLSATSMVDEQYSGRYGASAQSHGESTARGQVGPGLMRLEAWAYGSTEAFQAPSTGSASGSAWAGLRDRFTIVAPGCLLCTPGSRGTMTFSLYFDGGLSGGGHYESDLPPSNGGGGYDFNANWSTTFGLQNPGGPVWDNVGGSAGGTYRGNQDPSSVVSTSTGLGAGWHSFTIDFAFGYPLELQWQSRVAAVVHATSTGNETHLIASSNALADFSHTFAWGGIQLVLDANGKPVSGFTALNDTGFDYALGVLRGGGVSVPEPGTFALMLASLFGMAACAQRRRQRH
jgi:hypothetical protein